MVESSLDRSGRLHPGLVILCGLVGLGLATGLLLLLQRREGGHEVLPSSPSSPAALEPASITDPRTSLPTRFHNVAPHVKYLGDQACVSCHPRHVETFAKHSMGRSLTPVHASTPSENYDAAAHNPFTTGVFEYAVSHTSAGAVHTESVRKADGTRLYEAPRKVDYTVGSGARGRSYLMDRDGYLFMSPITWYPLKGVWDLSPGYHVYNQHFNRLITAECLFCHTNHAERVPGTNNKFQPPTFRGFSIGCERCHGPGELHVRRWSLGESFTGTDDTIVNPGKLEPDLREAVCQQCHLQGSHRVLRRGREPFDYRPGLPLHAFMSVFVRAAPYAVNNKFVGQVEQMYASRCFQESKGKMGCISCHDPHEMPAPTRRVAYFRDRCLKCHGDRGCSLPEAERKTQQPDGSCIACHMPVQDANITHTAFSDHRVLRRQDSGDEKSNAFRLQGDQVPLTSFYRHLQSEADPEVQRDLGIALIEMIERHGRPELAPQLARLALPRLEQAIARDADDQPAVLAKAMALSALGQPIAAAEVLDRLVPRARHTELVLYRAGNLALAMNRTSVAVRYWEQAVAINPHSWHNRAGLAAALAANREWQSAVYEAEKTLALNPADLDTRRVLVGSLIELKDIQRAEAEVQAMAALAPKDAEAMLKFFKDRTQPR